MRLAGDRLVVMQFKHLTDELRELLKREFQEQVAAIDKELQALGIAPDEFDAAAPEVVVSRRRA